jgi:hypothetical protein
MRTIAVALGLAAFALPAFADEVQLVNGRKLEGIVLQDEKQPGKVVLEVGAGVIILDAKEVSSVTKGPTKLHEYYEREKQVAGSRKAGDFHALAVWARQNGCFRFVRGLCEKAVALEPNHEGARRELGFERVGAKWLAHDEAMAAKGFIRAGDRWITPAEKELAEKKKLEAKERKVALEMARATTRDAEYRRQLEASWREEIERARNTPTPAPHVPQPYPVYVSPWGPYAPFGPYPYYYPVGTRTASWGTWTYGWPGITITPAIPFRR